METSKSNNNRALTLIEMMVVTGIVIVITGISFVGYKSGQSQIALQMSAQELVSNLRRAQSMALSTVIQSGQASAGGYGIYLDTNQKTNYRFFADTHNVDPLKPAYDDPLSDSITKDSITNVIELKSGVGISDISLTKNDDPPSSPNSTYIIFTPPDPIITIGDNSADQLSVTFYLKNAPAQIKTVTINKFGKIDIK